MVEILDIDCNNQIQKKYITILYEDKETRVSWYADTPLEDTRFALLCACDSLCDSEFELLNDKAKPIEINSITNFIDGQIYFLRRKNTNAPTKILLDGKRKLLVEIEPLRHLEAQVAVKYTLIGSNLLKHTYEGFPHIRLFQISSDLRRILWYTKSKPLSDSCVHIESIVELSIGQTSENFLKYPLKMLEDFSFSIYYRSKEGSIRTLDITCKDEREFDLWMISIKALYTHFLNKMICKSDLLNHSKSYRNQIEKGNIANCSKFLIYDETGSSSIEGKIKEKKTLEKFIVSRNLNQREIAHLFVKLSNRIRHLRGEVSDVLEEDTFKTGEQSKEYVMIFNDDAIVDDLETQKTQMCKLFSECEKSTGYLLQEFLWYSKEHKLKMLSNVDECEVDDFMKLISDLECELETNLSKKSKFNSEQINVEYFLKELDIKLWKIEIDIENVGDIVNRFKFPKKEGIFDKVKNLFR